MADLKETYNETIRQLVPIFSLSAQYQKELIQRSEIIEMRKGQYLFKQGDRDDFSFYLLEGALEMETDGQVQSSIQGGSDSARYPLAQLQPRQLSARAKTAAKVLQVNRNALDKLLVMEEKASDDSGSEVEVSDLGTAGDQVDWMTRMLQSELFSRLPTANIHQLFTALKAVEFPQGEYVIRQGDPGDYYYIIQEGRCEVLRRSSDEQDDIRLAELGPGDSFGEEALLSGATRNATVRMLSDGVLMRMDKANFIELIKKPALGRVDYAEACRRFDAGAELVDVRLPEEYAQSHIASSRSLPLATLRSDMRQLAADREYIVYCDSGGRSSIAAFLMAQQGYAVSYLDGGLMSCPSSDLRSGGTEAKPAAGSEEQAPEKLIDPDVRASAYDAEVAVADYEMQNAASQQPQADDEAKRAEYEAMARKLREEHARLQAARERAAAEAERYRQEEEARIQKMREEAEQQLQAQKQELEAVYAQNAKEMERLRTLKKQAEEQIQGARQKAEQESAEAQRRMQEAETIKQQLHDAKAAIEREAESQRQKQVELEEKIQSEAFAKLEAERKKLAEQYQRSSEALEQAQQEKAAAEAARKAANEEAQRIIAEFKEAHARTRAEEEAKLKAEREKLEQQSREIRESMASIKKAREDAEAAREAAEAQLAKLKIKQAQTKNKQDEKLRERIRAAEAEASQAKQDLDQVNQAQQAVQQAQENNIRSLERQGEEEQKLHAQIESEIADWLSENELEAPSREDLEKQAEHIRRIKERAEAAKHQSKQAAQNLLDDIANQLDK